MRRTVFFWIGIVLIHSIATAATWYLEYDAALKAIAAKDWTTAESRLNASIKLQPHEGRRVFAYGVRFIKYIPHYYLGVVQFHQARYEEAIHEFNQTEDLRLVVSGDPEYGEMRNLLQLAEQMLKQKTLPASPVPTVEKANKPDDEPKPAVATPAESNNNANVELLKPKEIPAQINDSTQKALADTKNREIEDRGLLAFFSGDYRQAISFFQQAIATNKENALAWFYLGCSHASLALLNGEKGNVHFLKAKQGFSTARKLDPRLSYNRELISPRVIEIYENAR